MIWFPGMNQQTAATQQIVRAAAGVRRMVRRSKRAKGTKRKASTPRKKATKALKRLVKGSAAAKAWGRKMKALRRK